MFSRQRNKQDANGGNVNADNACIIRFIDFDSLRRRQRNSDIIASERFKRCNAERASRRVCATGGWYSNKPKCHEQTIFPWCILPTRRLTTVRSFLGKIARIAPQPYPSPNGAFLGTSGYCTSMAANGYSIESGNLVDATKLNDIVSLGVRWVRLAAPQFSDDVSHVFGAGRYSWGDFDSAQCSTIAEHGIRPVIGLTAGPVEYNATPGLFSPTGVPTYQSAYDFGQWCGAVASHEKSAFPSVSQFSLPGNEVNNDPLLFPGGNSQIAAYSEACYAAIKAANPQAFVYGFELNMDGNLNAPAFVSQMVALGCKVGTCYDGIAMHLSLRYPMPASGTPCYPSVGGDYSILCVNAIQNAAQSPIHVLISESVVTIPSSVPDEATKATAVVQDFNAFAANQSVDGVSYGNVDECALYPTGVFANGCLISVAGQALPAYYALQQSAQAEFQ